MLRSIFRASSSLDQFWYFGSTSASKVSAIIRAQCLIFHWQCSGMRAVHLSRYHMRTQTTEGSTMLYPAQLGVKTGTAR